MLLPSIIVIGPQRESVNHHRESQVSSTVAMLFPLKTIHHIRSTIRHQLTTRFSKAIQFDLLLVKQIDLAQNFKGEYRVRFLSHRLTLKRIQREKDAVFCWGFRTCGRSVSLTVQQISRKSKRVNCGQMCVNLNYVTWQLLPSNLL